jgi:outer membrane protein TolC
MRNRNRSGHAHLSAWLLSLVFFAAARAWADPPAAIPENPQQVLTQETAIAWALQNNPDLAVTRKQRGVAESAIVIARTYPFNPVLGTAVMGIGGPADAGITNRVFNQNTLTQEVEVRGQGKIRRAIAAAALSRVEWEIVAQEQSLAVRTMRAFAGFLYQQEKLRLLDERIRLEEQTANTVKKLVDQGKLRPVDLVLARCDESEARGQRGPRLNQVILAWHELRGLLGVQTEIVTVAGELARTAPGEDPDQWMQLARAHRADLQVAQVAYQEAAERERLEVANRFGNPNIGLKTEYNESRIYFTGGTLQFAVPVFNARRGEILQRRAEKGRVLAEQKRLEIQICQQVLGALDHLQQARKSAQLLETDVLPTLRTAKDALEQLFAQGDPGVDILRWSDVRRRYSRGAESYLDALWELNQARADLASAVGNFTLLCDVSSPPLAHETRLGPPIPTTSAP